MRPWPWRKFDLSLSLPPALQCATRNRLPATRNRFDLKRKTGDLAPGEESGGIEITTQWFFNPKITPDVKQKRQSWSLTGDGIESDTEVGQLRYTVLLEETVSPYRSPRCFVGFLLIILCFYYLWPKQTEHLLGLLSPWRSSAHRATCAT